MGAGAIGCYVGGCLAAAGADVVLVGRERLKAELGTSGLSVSGLEGARLRRVPKVVFHTDASALGDRDLVLVTVKCSHSIDAAQKLAAVLRPGSLVVSLQNGIRNAEVLRAHLPNTIRVLGGIVGFNVVSKGSGNFRQATTGPLVIEAEPRIAALQSLFVSAGLEVKITPEIQPLQWSKLVMNLNNAVSALTNQPTKTLLFGEGYRRILAAIIEEAVGVLKKSGIRTARLGPIPVRAFPFVLRLPAPLLRIVASAQVKVDAEARSSMWEDLSLRRKTEVDFLNGEIVRLAEANGLVAKLNARVVQRVHEVEERGQGSPGWSAAALWSALTD
jgi:2-dehydropantoate 2-reductase